MYRLTAKTAKTMAASTAVVASLKACAIKSVGEPEPNRITPIQKSFSQASLWKAALRRTIRYYARCLQKVLCRWEA